MCINNVIYAKNEFFVHFHEFGTSDWFDDMATVPGHEETLFLSSQINWNIYDSTWDWFIISSLRGDWFLISSLRGDWLLISSFRGNWSLRRTIDYYWLSEKNWLLFITIDNYWLLSLWKEEVYLRIFRAPFWNSAHYMAVRGQSYKSFVSTSNFSIDNY